MMSKSKIIFIILFVVIFFGNYFPVFAVLNLPIKKFSPTKYSSDEVLVTFKKGKVNLANPGLVTFFREFNTRLTNKLNKSEVIETANIAVYKITDGRTVQQVIDDLKNDSNVESVDPNYYLTPADLGTNDTYKNNLWGLNNYGQTLTFDNGTTSVGTSGADIKMVQAWGVSVGTTGVVVAVIDTGVAYNHPDLINNMWDGTNCVDDTGTPIIGGCLHGYDYAADDNDPIAGTNSHGTHVAGNIAATRNNSIGIAGVGPNIKIMAVKFALDSITEIKAIDFATQNGAKVINASFTSSSYSAGEYAAIQRFRAAGGIFVAAAGNAGTDNDVAAHVYPSDYDLDNIISVAATDIGDSLASFSNFGSSSVDVAAPGVNILSAVTYKQDYYETLGPPIDLNFDLGSYWKIIGLSDGSNALIGDSNAVSTPNYFNNSDYYVTSNTIDLSIATTSSPAEFAFTSVCTDSGTTIADNSAASDYMALDISNDGIGFTEVARWNQLSMSALPGSICDGSSCQNTFAISVGTTYLNNSFKYRYHWVTDASLSTSPGCYIYDTKILDYPAGGDTASYDYKSGTSIAASYVAGLAGYLLTVNPAATYTDVINNILTFGDTLPSLVGKSTTGKRINAYNSVLNIGTTVTPTNTPTATPTPVPVNTLSFVDSGSSPSGYVTGNIGGTINVTEPSGSYWITLRDSVGVTQTVIINNTIGTTGLTDFTFSLGETIYTDIRSAGVSMAVLGDGSTYTISIHQAAYTAGIPTLDGTTFLTSINIAQNYITPTPTSTPTPTPTPTTSPPSQNNNSNNNNGPPSPPGPPACNDKSPKVGPDLFAIKTEKGKATIYFSPTAEKTTAYAVIYGLKKGDERFGYIGDFKTNNQGVQNLTISALNPKSTYYFKVAGINNCDITPWSDWVPAQPNTKKSVYKYKTIIINRLKTLVSIFK